MEGVDKLGVETRGNFNTHTADEEVEIHPPQVGFLVPWHFILLDHTRDNRIGSMAEVGRFEDTREHDGGVGEARRAP